MRLSSKNKKWLEAFGEVCGRPPRILHIGNIANNAYLNSKILNEAGIESDVICYDYYHIMGCPEWEEVDFRPNNLDQIHPNWQEQGLNGFERPQWFAQGPLNLCINYLIARKKNKKLLARIFWLLMGKHNQIFKLNNILFLNLFDFFRKICSQINRDDLYLAVWRVLGRFLNNNSMVRTLFFISVVPIIFLALISIKLFFVCWNFLVKPKIPNSYNFDKRMNDCQLKFAEFFPARSDPLVDNDMSYFRNDIDRWQDLFIHYDIIQAYSTDGVYPLLCSKVPYITFEHGTLRNIPYEPTSQGRLCSLTYRMANWTFVTNADNISSAHRLGIKNFSFIPHPVNEKGIFKEELESHSFENLHKKYRSNFLIFHPSRQHWSFNRHGDWDKGNDIFLKGFARFVKEVNSSATAILVEWGATVAESKKLINTLGIEQRVVWINPLPHMEMVRYIKSCDLVADQFYLGSFGSTLPKVMACGRSSLIYINHNNHLNCFSQIPPVLNAKNEIEVFNRLSTVWKDNNELKKLEIASIKWYKKYHSNDVILNKLMEVYSLVLNDKGFLD